MPPHVPAAGRLWDEADLVIAFGSDLDGDEHAELAASRSRRALVAVNADAGGRGEELRASTSSSPRSRPAAPAAARRSTRCAARLRAVRAEACRALDPRALRFLDAVSFALPDDAVVVCDMCIPGYWIAGFHGFPRPRRLQYPVGWGTLGFAFPAALGAALAGTGPTVSICGDGGFLFACGELATMAQEQLPLTAVIVDDGGYGMLRYDQELAGDDALRRRPAHARLRGARRELRRARRDGRGPRRRVRRGARAARRRPGPSVLVAKAEALVPPPTTSPNWYRKQTA